MDAETRKVRKVLKGHSDIVNSVSTEKISYQEVVTKLLEFGMLKREKLEKCLKAITSVYLSRK